MKPITELRRRLKGTTVSAVARELKVSRQAIYNVLNGAYKPGAKMVMALNVPRERWTLDGATHFVYRAFDSKGRLLYVGRTLCVKTRLQAHAKDSRWFKRMSRMEVAPYPTKEKASEAESKAISEEKPEFNVLPIFRATCPMCGAPNQKGS